MKITGTRSYVKFDMENGYILKAEGEMLLNNQFVVYKNTMKHWEAPHDSEPISQLDIDNIIEETNKSNDKGIVTVLFE